MNHPVPNPDKQQAMQLFQSGQYDMSRNLFDLILKTNPVDFDACFFLGVIAFRENDKLGAIKYLEKAIKLRTRAPAACFQLGLAYHDMGNPESAVRSLRNAVLYKPDYRQAYLALAEILTSSGKYRELAELSSDAIKIIPDFGEMHVNLVFSLERLNKGAEAISASSDALKVEPDNLKLRFTIAKLEKRNGDIQNAIDMLNSLLKEKISPFQYSAIAGELGDIFDQTGQYDKAIKEYTKANQSTSSTVKREAYELSGLFKLISNYKSCVRKEVIADWTEGVSQGDEYSPVFIVGFPRSGTTLIEQILATNDLIVPSDEKPLIELLKSSHPEIFADSSSYPEKLKDLNREQLSLLRDSYFALAKKLTDRNYDPFSKVFLDKLPLNIIDIGLINRIFPESKVIVAIRDPRDSCLSCYIKQFVPNEAMLNFTDIENTGKFYSDVMGLWEHYKQTIPVDYIEVRYEDIVSNFESKTRELMGFLELEWSDSVFDFHKKTSERNITTPSYSSVSSEIYDTSTGRWKNYSNLFKPIDELLRPYIEGYGYE